MKFSDIRQITTAKYSVDVPIEFMKQTIEGFRQGFGVLLEPDFQRGHIWTEEQQSKYVEWLLQGGPSGRDILWNCPGWMKSFEGPVVLVDGLQRVTAIQSFLEGELKVFGHRFKEFEDKLGVNPMLKFHMNDLTERYQVLQWYISVNDGGVVHSSDEIERVRQLLKDELRKHKEETL